MYTYKRLRCSYNIYRTLYVVYCMSYIIYNRHICRTYCCKVCASRVTSRDSCINMSTY